MSIYNFFMKKKIESHSTSETFNLAKELAQKAKNGTIFALTGDLGSGKTIFAKGVAQALNIKEDITSPTFNLLEIYEGSKKFYHFDLYRIENEIEFDNLFFEEYWEDDGISVIEWAERAKNRITGNIIKITFEYIDESSRRITIEHPGH